MVSAPAACLAAPMMMAPRSLPSRAAVKPGHYLRRQRVRSWADALILRTSRSRAGTAHARADQLIQRAAVPAEGRQADTGRTAARSAPRPRDYPAARGRAGARRRSLARARRPVDHLARVRP